MLVYQRVYYLINHALAAAMTTELECVSPLLTHSFYGWLLGSLSTRRTPQTLLLFAYYPIQQYFLKISLV